MEFILMKLVGQSIRPGSIFGILDKDNPGQLPPAPGGRWSDHGTMTDENFPFAAEANRRSQRVDISLLALMLSKRSAVRLVEVLSLRLIFARRAPADAPGAPFDLCQGGIERGMRPLLHSGHGFQGVALRGNRELICAALRDAAH